MSSQKGGILNGMMIGAGLMYLLDPDKGRRRRAMLRDRVVHLAHQVDDGLNAARRDMRNRALGIAAETRGRFRREHVSDEVIEARVRSALGRLVSHPGAVRVDVRAGRVTLSGDVLAAEHQALRSGVASVRGVGQVVDQLSVHAQPGGIPSLQGGGSRPAVRIDLLQENWAPGTRLLMGVLGGVLAIRGIRSEEILPSLGGVVGMGLLVRSATNLEVRRLTGMEAGRRAVEIHKIITVNAPVREVFEFWSNFENFPRFMSHLREVRRTGSGRSIWVAAGPAGLSFAWEAEITAFEPDRMISWQSIGDSPIRNEGVVRFQDVGQGCTRLDVRLCYNPPAGAIGHAVASFLRLSPRQMMNDDLVRLKSLLEDGKTTANHHEVWRDDLPVVELASAEDLQ